MQLYALEGSENITFVKNTNKQKTYTCLECGQRLGIRLGTIRQAHFYHLDKPLQCNQSGKSEIHIALQLYFKELIPECVLEKRMPTISRIADVVWEEKKIVFEIQCSFISKQELEKRNQDYASLGLQVIWILHDKSFDKPAYLAAEQALLGTAFFRTNFNENGEGMIFDQWDIAVDGLKKVISKPFPVQLNQLHRLPMNTSSSFFRAFFSKKATEIEKRLYHWPYCFEGEILDHLLLKNDQDLLQKLKLFEKPVSKAFKLSSILKTIKRIYFLILHLLLEKACR